MRSIPDPPTCNEVEPCSVTALGWAPSCSSKVAPSSHPTSEAKCRATHWSASTWSSCSHNHVVRQAGLQAEYHRKHYNGAATAATATLDCCCTHNVPNKPTPYKTMNTDEWAGSQAHHCPGVQHQPQARQGLGACSEVEGVRLQAASGTKCYAHCSNRSTWK